LQGSGVCLYIRRGCSAIFCGLSCSRLFNYGVFFCVCMASLLGQVAPVVVALLDTPVLVALYLLCGMPSNEVRACPPHPSAAALLEFSVRLPETLIRDTCVRHPAGKPGTSHTASDERRNPGSWSYLGDGCALSLVDWPQTELEWVRALRRRTTSSPHRCSTW